MCYNLLNLFVVSEEPTNVFVIGEPMSNKEDSKLGYYDADKDVVYLFQASPKSYKTIVLFSRSQSVHEVSRFLGYYELHIEKKEMLLKYLEYKKVN